MPETTSYPASAEEIRDRNKPNVHEQRSREVARQADEEVSELCTIISDVLHDPRANELLDSGRDLILWTSTSIVGWKDVARTNSMVITPDRVIRINQEAYQMLPDGSLMGINVNPDAPSGWNKHVNKPLGASRELRGNLYSLQPTEVRKRIEYQLNPDFVTDDQKELNNQEGLIDSLSESATNLENDIRIEWNVRHQPNEQYYKVSLSDLTSENDKTLANLKSELTKLMPLVDRVQGVSDMTGNLDIAKYNQDIGKAIDIAKWVKTLSEQVAKLEAALADVRRPLPQPETPVQGEAGETSTSKVDAKRGFDETKSLSAASTPNRLRDVPRKMFNRLRARLSFLSGGR